MKAIIVSEQRLKELLEDTLKELELKTLKEKFRDNLTLSDMHRSFHYEVCRLVDKIRDS